jgi:hypothetical protein
MREVILHYSYAAWQLLGSSPDVPMRASALLHRTLSVDCEVVSKRNYYSTLYLEDRITGVENLKSYLCT